MCVCVLGSGSSLLIESVSVSDAATYTCSASNIVALKLEERTGSLQVIVHCE